MSELKSGSNLEKVLAAGHFAFTGECGPPKGANVEHLNEKLSHLVGHVDAVNMTDNQTAVVRMSSIAGSVLMMEQGLEPNFQMVCRDRNRLAMMSDILGAYAMGIRNMLCLSGDHQSAGAGGKLNGHPGAKNVYDIDSIQLISIVRGMRDDAVQDGGDSISPAAPFFIGAAWTPLGPPEKFRTIRLAKKVNAGADFIQTQAVYDMKRFAEAVRRAQDLGLTDKVAILPGIIIPRSAGMLRYMNNNVPGIEVPDELIARMKDAADPAEEGIKITLELIEAARNLSGIKGVHLQAIEAEGLLPDVIKAAGLLPRPHVY